MSNEFSEIRSDHCAVSLGNFLIIFGGWPKIGHGRAREISTRVIWTYNLYTEEWKKHGILNTSCVPEPFGSAVAVAIDKTIYTFGGRSIKSAKPRNAIWKLNKTNEGCFTWRFNKPQCKEKSPSPRADLAGWEYAGNLWIFAGLGDSPEGYLNDNGDIDLWMQGCGRNNQLPVF